MDAIKTTEDATASRSARLQSKKRPKTAEDQEGAAAANATAAAAPLAKETGSVTGSKACIIHCLETGDKLAANFAQIIGMSGTIRAMVEDLSVDTADTAAAVEIPIAGVSGDVAKGILQCIEAYHDEPGAKQKEAATKMPESMMDLYRLGDDASGRKGHEHWSGYGSNYITKLVEAVEFLDVPKLMTIILTIVGEEISSLAGKRMKRLSRTTTPGKSYHREPATAYTTPRVAESSPSQLQGTNDHITGMHQ